MWRRAQKEFLLPGVFAADTGIFDRLLGEYIEYPPMAAKTAAAAAAAALATVPPRALRTAVTAGAPAGLAVVPIRACSLRSSAAAAARASPLFVDEDGPYHSQFADAPGIDRDWLEARLG